MATYKARHPRNIPASYYKPIGQILSRWIYAELYMMSIVWHFLGIKDQKVGRLLTWGNSPSNKVKLFSSLLKRRDWVPDPSDKAEIERLHGIAARLVASRNRLAHGLWAQRQGDGKKFRLFYMPDNEIKILPGSQNTPIVTLKELRQWARQIDRLNIDLKKFHKKIGAAVP